MPDIPESLIKTMSYQTRLNNFQQELAERLHGEQVPLAKYYAIVRYLTRKWRI